MQTSQLLFDKTNTNFDFTNSNKNQDNIMTISQRFNNKTQLNFNKKEEKPEQVQDKVFRKNTDENREELWDNNQSIEIEGKKIEDKSKSLWDPNVSINVNVDINQIDKNYKGWTPTDSINLQENDIDQKELDIYKGHYEKLMNQENKEKKDGSTDPRDIQSIKDNKDIKQKSDLQRIIESEKDNEHPKKFKENVNRIKLEPIRNTNEKDQEKQIDITNGKQNIVSMNPNAFQALPERNSFNFSQFSNWEENSKPLFKRINKQNQKNVSSSFDQYSSFQDKKYKQVPNMRSQNFQSFKSNQQESKQIGQFEYQRIIQKQLKQGKKERKKYDYIISKIIKDKKEQSMFIITKNILKDSCLKYNLKLEDCCLNHCIGFYSGRLFIYDNQGQLIIIDNLFSKKEEQRKQKQLKDRRENPQLYLYENSNKLGKLFLIGGKNRMTSQGIDEVLVYCIPQQISIKELESLQPICVQMSYQRVNPMVFKSNKNLYIFGGCQSCNGQGNRQVELLKLCWLEGRQQELKCSSVVLRQFNESGLVDNVQWIGVNGGAIMRDMEGFIMFNKQGVFKMSTLESYMSVVRVAKGTFYFDNITNSMCRLINADYIYYFQPNSSQELQVYNTQNKNNNCNILKCTIF